MSKNILCIDILKNDVYIEYTNGDIEYVSFTQAKKTIILNSASSITYECVDNEKSVTFLNSLLTRYYISGNKLVLKQT